MPGERTEQATQHRREQARKEGDILHSRELTAAAGALAGVMVLGALGSRVLIAWRDAFAGFLDLGLPAHWEPSQMQPTLYALRRLAMGIFGPPAAMMAAVAGAALLAGIVQTGGVSFHMGAIGFKPDRINPVTNVKNLFSLRAAARLAKSLVPASLLAVFAVQRIGRQLTVPPFSTARLEMLGADVYGLLLAAAWLLFGWSAIDYLVEWQSRESRLKMSRQDLRDEFKETEGNPAIKNRVRRLQRQARRRRMLKDVERAAVVITNPTEFAVALEFRLDMDAPVVVAKGRNLLAAQIREVALWQGIPLVENPPLAHALYRAVEVGQAIPPKLYAVVAEILAAIWRAQARASQSAGQSAGQTAVQSSAAGRN
jgi:flagellar biosynthesis protein FlhB